MPIWKCVDCQHEWEGSSKDDVCDWCQSKGQIIETKTDLEKSVCLFDEIIALMKRKVVYLKKEENEYIKQSIISDLEGNCSFPWESEKILEYPPEKFDMTEDEFYFLKQMYKKFK